MLGTLIVSLHISTGIRLDRMEIRLDRIEVRITDLSEDVAELRGELKGRDLIAGS